MGVSVGEWQPLPPSPQGSFQMVQSLVGDPGHGWKEPLEQFGSDQGIPHATGSSMLSPGPGAGEDWAGHTHMAGQPQEARTAQAGQGQWSSSEHFMSHLAILRPHCPGSRHNDRVYT